MATPEQRAALLAIPCPWCAATPGELCSTPAPGGRARRDTEGGVRRGARSPIRTLDAGCHDARWQAAGLGTAPVVAGVVARLHEPEDGASRGRQPVMAGSGGPGNLSVGERPW